VVRLYESRGRATTTALATRIPHTRATLVDLLERPLGPADLSRLELGPFQLLTLLLEP
jgi:alpha-mannosidase